MAVRGWSAPWPTRSTATAASTTAARGATSLAAIGGYVVRQFSGNEMRQPPRRCP
jgi:hypothetical protein